MKSGNYLNLLPFLLPFKLGNVRLFLKKTDTAGTKKAQDLQTQLHRKKSLAPYCTVYYYYFQVIKDPEQGTCFFCESLAPNNLIE